MRIISGKLKGAKLFLPKDKSTRPLKDLVKESIFNLLDHSKKMKKNLENSSILDLFLVQVLLDWSVSQEALNLFIFLKIILKRLKFLRKIFPYLKKTKTLKFLKKIFLNSLIQIKI